MRESHRAYRIADLRAEFERIGSSRVREQQRKLLATESCDEVAGAPHASRDRLRDLSQARIAGNMTVCIVESLEVIDIDHRNSESSLVTAAPSPFVLQRLVQGASVCQAGQGISRCDLRELCISLFMKARADMRCARFEQRDVLAIVRVSCTRGEAQNPDDRTVKSRCDKNCRSAMVVIVFAAK
jgi:hypothetical protein